MGGGIMHNINRNRHDIRRNSSWDVEPARVAREKLSRLDGEIQFRTRTTKRAKKGMTKEEFRKRMLEVMK